MAGTHLSMVRLVSGFDAAPCHRHYRPNPIDGFFPRARSFSPVVGAPGRLEKLSRSMAFRRLCGVFGKPVRAIPSKLEGKSGALAQREGAVEDQRPPRTRHRIPGTYLDGRTHSLQ